MSDRVLHAQHDARLRVVELVTEGSVLAVGEDCRAGGVLRGLAVTLASVGVFTVLLPDDGLLVLDEDAAVAFGVLAAEGWRIVA